MIDLGNKLAVAFLIAVSIANAKYKPSIQTLGGINLKVTEDAILKFRGNLGFLNQLEQVDEYPFVYEKKGLTSKGGTAGIEIAVGKLNKLEISTGGDISFLTRKMDDSLALHDYFEIRPSGNLNLMLPFGGFFKANFLMRGERRIFRQPNSVVTQFRYSSETRLSSDATLPLHTGFFLFYRGFAQDASKSMSQWGGGVTFEPVENLSIETGYSIQWKPEFRNSAIYPITLGLSYTFDFTK